MHDDSKLRVPQEIAFTTEGLIRVALIGVVGFAMMAWMVDGKARPLAVGLGVMTTGAIALVLAYHRGQQRYGTATLIAERPFEHGKPFTGTIATELREAPDSPIRIRISGWRARNEITLGRTTVDPVLLRRAVDGTLSIPFHIPPIEVSSWWKPREVRLHARTSHWPIGWGARFVIAKDH